MSSLEQDESPNNENGSVTRRTRSGRPSKSPAPAAIPKATRSRKQVKKPVFEETEEIEDMSTLDNFFAQEESEDFEMPMSDGNEQPLKNDSPANISRALGDESNGSMDGMLKTCFEDNIITTEGRDQSIPIEPMDVSITDSTEDSSNIPLEFDNINQADMNFMVAGDPKESSDSEVEEVEEPSDEMEQDPMEQEFVEQEPAEQEPAEEEPAKQKPAEEEPAKQKPAEQKPPEREPKEQEPAEQNLKEQDNAQEVVAKLEEQSRSADRVKDPKQIEKVTELAVDSKKKEENIQRDDETEVVSEDELPGVEKPEVKDAENVSDDELPGPKPADLPADTEVVSEDELPSSKKETISRKRKAGSNTEVGYDPGSPTSEGESSAKKPSIVKDGDAKSQAADKKATEEKPAKKKALPELDKYWKAVNDDATDFTGWTYLLQYVDQENDVEAAREAYDAFLSHYPYCYGYWRKYGDYEKRKGSKKKCLEQIERGTLDIFSHRPLCRQTDPTLLEIQNILLLVK